MIKKIKQFINLHKENINLKEENKRLEEENKRLEEKKPVISACDVIEKILKRGIKWIPYEDFAEPAKKEYYKQAQLLLDNKVFKNEINHYIDDLMVEIATKAKDMDAVLDLRMSINGVKALKERIESIKDPSVAPKKITEKINDPI